MNKIFFLLILSVFIFLNSGCIKGSHAPKDYVLAKVANRAITEEDFLNALKEENKKAYLSFKKKTLDELVAQRLLELEAKKNKVTIEQFFKENVSSKVTISPQEIDDFYRKNEKEYKKKKKDEREKEISEKIRQLKTRTLGHQLLTQLSKKFKAVYYLP